MFIARNLRKITNSQKWHCQKMAPAIRIWCCWNNKDVQAALEQSGYIIDVAHCMFQGLETGKYIHYTMTLNDFNKSRF